MLGLNNAYIEELYFQFLRDPDTVSADWQAYFRSHRGEIERDLGVGSAATSGQTAAPAPRAETSRTNEPIATPTTNGAAARQPDNAAPPDAKPAPAGAPKANIPLGPADELEKLTGTAGRIVVNMERSLTLPTATSVRSIPTKVLDENRRIINHFLKKRNKRKISFTHIIAWTIVQGLIKYPRLNHAYAEVDGKPHRVARSGVNIGLAVDVVRKDGSRALVVPSIKDAQNLSFPEFIEQYDLLIQKSRVNKLEIDDLMGATVTLTNPGMIGTIASMPRLMEGQGLIIASGSIDYPPEYKATTPDVLAKMAWRKIMTVTSTYDHRIVQGAESGEFLAFMERLMLGEDRFYDRIFASLQIPFEPACWSVDKRVAPFDGGAAAEEEAGKEAKVRQLINAYRVRGHLYADLNPMGIAHHYYPELDASFYGFTVWDLDREYHTWGLCGTVTANLRDILTMVRETYCGSTGIEYMHMQDSEKKLWVQRHIEKEAGSRHYEPRSQRRIFKKLVEAETFESFVHTKFLGAKRFSLEGCEAIIPMLDNLLAEAAVADLKEVYMGMAHRGRLNVLVNIIGKSAKTMFQEFKGELDPESFHGSGDVKYHLGACGEYTDVHTGKKLTVTLASNPSHLESVDPVVQGMARSRQDELNDTQCSEVMPVLIHGDSAFAGQGVVAETLNLANLRGYTTGGTIHIIINNQIGFTTGPDEARSTIYATDIAKMLQVPILHVNGADPEAVLAAAEFALAYRMKFHEDVVIDIFCYRKYGHNETDEPAYTQPLMYKKIKTMELPSVGYRRRLVNEGAITDEESDAVIQQAKAHWNEAYAPQEDDKSVTHTPPQQIEIFAPTDTAVNEQLLDEVAVGITRIPEDFNIHRKLRSLLEKRADMMSNDNGIDWGMGEALAFGTLVVEGVPVRLSGQDSARGTFSHRHAVLVDQENEREYCPLNAIRPDKQETFRVYDSSLSELAVLGFEYGYSVERPKGLTIWEAQFGDFVNGAQILIDQFISSAEEKWDQTSNLVMLLPHGYEGQGPEHSSARLERFLQLCAQDNMAVCNFTSAAQFFHALRRQVLRPFNKPMIVMTPKSFLRDPIAASKKSEFTNGTFQEVIDDTHIEQPDQVRRVLLCSGKVYFDLVKMRRKLDSADVAIVRVEQLYPFHAERIREILHKYDRAKTVMWVQEEPKNMGAWFFVQPRLSELLTISQNLSYCGRSEGASTATGFATIHQQEQEELLRAAFAR